jgi:tetratricopeptide (TPR) repeat protein
LYSAANSAYLAKDLVRAIALYERVIQLMPGHAEAHYKRGNALKDLGQFAAALDSYDAAVQQKPDFSHAWCNRGVVQQRLELSAAALVSYDRAVALDPADTVAHSNRGALLQSLSRWEEALASYQRTLELNPQSFQAWFHHGNVLRELRQLDPALVSYGEAIKLKPDYAEAYYNRGVVLELIQRPRAALESYDQAIEIYPGFHQAHYNRAGVLKELKELEAALASYDRAIAIKGDHAQAHSNRGAVLRELARPQEALASYDRAIEICPDHAEGYFNRGTVLKALMQWDEALASYERAIALKPDYAAAYCDRAGVLMEVGRVDAALASYNRAIAIQSDFPEAQYNRSLALLLTGDYESGWLNYEWRWNNADRLSLQRRTFSQPLWLGKESIAGKRLLIYSEQGLGDALQFCRFAKGAAFMGATVILEVQRTLAPLLARVEGISQVISDGDPLPKFDYHCPLLSLPLALGTTIDTIPATTRYLRSDAAKVAWWRTRLGRRTRPRIGLAWSGNPNQGNDHNRSLRMAEWVAHLPRQFQYISLQKDVRAADEEVLAANPWIWRLDRELKDFGDTAALCECLDLVISVCTSVAHLSAALGRPTWVLLPFNPDWRWLLDRDDSPWYPTATLYRQQTIGSWECVLERVASELRRGEFVQPIPPSAADR